MKVHDSIPPKIATWLAEQPVFFVASAPLSAEGHVNLSPKGMAGTFAVLSPTSVAYLDYYGSGAETVAHIRENGRITIMVPAFQGRPNIVRIYGRGSVVLTGQPGFAELRAAFAKQRETGQRAIITVDIDRVQESCGYSVPLMELQAERDILDRYQEKKGPDNYDLTRVKHNQHSIDGLPALVDSAGV